MEVCSLSNVIELGYWIWVGSEEQLYLSGKGLSYIQELIPPNVLVRHLSVS